ncbi:MAG: hypothetical protein JWO38_5019 [Gemmataceae bacterium]|nr:hypothetical protein [Gemmataceae bacterium]
MPRYEVNILHRELDHYYVEAASPAEAVRNGRQIYLNNDPQLAGDEWTEYMHNGTIRDLDTYQEYPPDPRQMTDTLAYTVRGVLAIAGVKITPAVQEKLVELEALWMAQGDPA